MIRYFFKLYQEQLYSRRLFLFLVITSLYLSLVINPELEAPLWRLVQIQNSFYLLLLLLPMYSVLFFPLFFREQELLKIRAVTKKRYFFANLLNVISFNIILIILVFVIISWISILFLQNNSPEINAQNIAILNNSALSVFESINLAAVISGLYMLVNFSVIISIIVLLGYLKGRIVGYISYVIFYFLMMWSSRTAFFESFSGEYAIFDLSTYLILPISNIHEAQTPVLQYLFFKWAILLAVFFSIMLFYIPPKNLFKIRYFDRLFISRKIIITSILFLIIYFKLFSSYYSEAGIQRFFAMYHYGSLTPIPFLWLICYFLFLPFILSIRFSELEENIDSLIVRHYRIKYWRIKCLKTVYRYLAVYFMLTSIFLSVTMLLTGHSFYLNELISLLFIFLELILITTSYLMFYFILKQTSVSFLLCLTGYLFLLFPFDWTKWLPFGLSSTTRINEVGYGKSILIFGTILLLEIWIISRGKQRNGYGKE